MVKYIPKAIRDRQLSIGGDIVDEGDGYYSLLGRNPVMGIQLAYICLPKGHPDRDVGYDDIGDHDDGDRGPDVNGGLTFSDGPVFGWDYGCCNNTDSPLDDIKSALNYFKKRV